MSEKIQHWYLPLIVGILFLFLGIWFILKPLTSYMTLILFFSVSFLFSGFIETIYSIANRKKLEHWGIMLAGGLLNLFIGFLLISNFELSLAVFSLYIGFWVLFRSIAQIVASFELKKYKRFISFSNLNTFFEDFLFLPKY